MSRWDEWWIVFVKSSKWRCPVKTSVLKNFAYFTGKHLCLNFQHRCFPAKFAKFIRTPILRTSEGLLLFCKMTAYESLLSLTSSREDRKFLPHTFHTHATSKVWTCVEPKFSLQRIKLCEVLVTRTKVKIIDLFQFGARSSPTLSRMTHFD